MPRLAATLASLLLIASSIGVNIARYPNVGRTADMTSANAAETAPSPQSISPAPPVEKANAAQSPAKPNLPAPSTREAGPNVVSNDLPSDRMVAVISQPTSAQSDGSVPIVDVRPMVSVGDNQASGAEPAAGQSNVQRLPAVDCSESFPAEGDTAVDGRSYPTTATP